MNFLVLYHDICMDGFCAAWLIHKIFPDAEFQAVSYQQPPPDVTGRDVIIVDFSYKRSVLEEMRKSAKTLRVYDHHKTAQQDLEGLTYCVFDMNRSGCMLAFDAIYVPFKYACERNLRVFRNAPWIVKYVQDRDLWQWKLPHSKEVNAALSSYPKVFEVWDKLDNRDLNELILEGTAILRYQDQLLELLSKQAEEVEISGHKVLSVNSPLLQSEIGNELAKGRPFAAVWYQHQGKRKYSLRSTTDGIDVSQIAEQQGGGGHPTAAGFMEIL